MLHIASIIVCTFYHVVGSTHPIQVVDVTNIPNPAFARADLLRYSVQCQALNDLDSHMRDYHIGDRRERRPALSHGRLHKQSYVPCCPDIHLDAMTVARSNIQSPGLPWIAHATSSGSSYRRPSL
jgi:hypothetical protein